MSRSGYSDDWMDWSTICWRGAVASSLRGRRGQAFLRELADAMDAMPERILIADNLRTANGCMCTLGVVGASRGIDLESLNPEHTEAVAKAFGIAPAMAAEIVFMNDEAAWNAETPSERWARMRAWVSEQIKPSAS